MDIYRFIDSRDMREHLQKLNYAFTPPEAAFLVYRCKAATLEEMRLQEQQQANALAIEQNDLLDRQNSIAEKARRDANIAAAVGAVQRHNTNKAIKNGWRNKQRRQVYHLPPYAFYWGWKKMRSLHNLLQGDMIQCASGLVCQIFAVSGALLIPQHGDGVGFGGMGLGKRPDQRQPIKICPGHSKVEIPVSGYGVI